MSAPAPRASVVVPTRDRPEPLRRCLAALDAQQVDGDLEVVVVDDGSTDADAVARVVAGSDRGRLVRGRGEGPAAARNLGVAVASAPWVCLTDDDCAPEPGWVAAIAGRLAGGADAVAGPTVNARPEDPFAAVSQAITNELTEGSSEDRGAHVRFAPTSNLAARRALLADLPFDESFPAAAGEDRDWCARAEERGVAIAWEPGAVVRHHQDLGARGFWRQQARYGEGAQRARARAGAATERQPLAFHLAVVRRARRSGLRAIPLVAVAQAATAAGYARSALRRRPDG